MWPRAQRTPAPRSTPAAAASCCTRPWTAYRSTRSPGGCTCCARRIPPGCRPWAAGSRTACGCTPACGRRQGRRRAGRWSGRRSVPASAASCPSYKHESNNDNDHGIWNDYRIFSLQKKKKEPKKNFKKECIQVGCVPPTRRPYLPGPGGRLIK